jgi:hypothetical protein
MRSYRYVLIALSLLATTTAVLAGPKVKIADDTFDFGKTVNSAILTHAFWIKSVGDQPLRITQVEPGCGCTKAPLRDSLLAPGDSTRLDITLSTKGFVGRIAKRPYIVTNQGPDQVYLKLFAEMVDVLDSLKPVAVTPSRVDVSQFNKLRRKSRFTLVNNSNVDQVVTVVDAAHKSFDVSLPRTLKAHGQIDGQLVVHEDAVKTSFEESFTIECVGDERNRLSVFVVRLYRPTEDAAGDTIRK